MPTVFLVGQEEKGNGPDYVSLSYFGEKVFHPGISTALLWHKRISPEQGKAVLNLEYGLSAAVYVHPRNHMGLQLKPQGGYFVTLKKGFEVGALAEMGYMRRFYQGEVFEVNDGNVQQKRLVGQNAFLYGGYIHLGYNPTLRSARKIKWFLRVGTFWEYPFNEGALMHPAMTLGISKKIIK